MKPILLTGTAAYSPFRLDALRAALGSYAPELKTAQIDARWVYAIQPEGDGPDEETLARAALLLNACGGERGKVKGVRATRQNHHSPFTIHHSLFTLRRGKGRYRPGRRRPPTSSATAG